VARSRSGTRGRRGPRKPPRRDGAFQSTVQVADPRERGAVELPATITVKELAELLSVNPADVIRELIKSGIFATINQLIDRDTASLVASELGYEVAEPLAVSAAKNGEDSSEAASEAVKEALFTEDESADLVARAPIVTVMGHVDHGKTSLLDAIRSTTVAAGERGGITQHIGASEVVRGDRRVVFLDTPGHEAFTAMRARGAKVTDVAVVVVAADDGVMPQTLEAISHAKAAKVPIIIALNKIDKPDANPDRVKTELTEAGVVIEEYGGETPLVPVSAKTGVGLDDLVDMVLLVADLQELKANPKRPAIGTIVEARMDKGRGPVATALVQTGTLHVGDVIVVGETFGRVKALENELGKRIQKVGPATPAVVLGLGAVPEAGDILRVVADEKAARGMVEARSAELAGKGGESGRATLEDLYKQIQAGQAKELRIILKADVSGSLGAITHALEQLPADEVKLNILHEGAGEISDNDILLAAASNAIVVGFNTSISDTAPRGSLREGRRPPLRHHLPAHRRHHEGPRRPARAGDRRGRRGSGRGPPGHQGRQEPGHRRLVRHRWPDRSRRRPGMARGQGRRDRPDRVAATVPGRRPRGPDGLRVRHRPCLDHRHRRGRRHRVLHLTDGVAVAHRLGRGPARQL